VVLENYVCHIIENNCYYFDRWDTVSNKLQSGEIKFRDIEKILGNRYQKDYDNMIVELKTFGLNVKCIHKRVDQLKKYRHLGDCVKGAKTILKFANDYNLKGDFKEIRIIANVSIWVFFVQLKFLFLLYIAGNTDCFNCAYYMI
jgi:hypothetical protein